MLKNKFTSKIASALTLVLLMGLSPLPAFAVVTTPATINYQGRLLNASSTPLTGAYTFRFSLWTSADWVAGDTDGLGAINTGAATYAGWNEAHAVTVGSFGLFDIPLGSVTPFPNFTAGTHDFLQVEVKPTASADTAYEILDPQGTTADTVDRKTIDKQAYAENADTVDNKEIGTGPNNIPVINGGGTLDIALIPGGTNQNTFIMDADDTGGDVTLKFGTALNETLTWNNSAGDFELSDDLDIAGGLTSIGAVDFSGASRLALQSGASTPLTCAEGDIFYNTTTNATLICTAANIWTGLATGGTPAFETIYAGDTNLITANGIFTINTGTNDFVVDSADWNVDNTGALDATSITSNGTLSATGLITGSAGATISGAATSINANSNFVTNINTGTSTGAVTIGGGSGSVAVNSTTWDISTAGVASGLTGITSTGVIDISGATRFSLTQGLSNPLTCTEGDLFYNTTDNLIYVCTAANTFTSLSTGGTPNFETIYAGDIDLTTTNGIFTINTGTNDFVVDSNDWNVTASGAFDAASITSNGALTATGTTNLNGIANFNGVTTIGDGGDTVAINSSTWDISTTGIASGFTGFTSTGVIDISGATRLSLIQGLSNPATCTEGDVFYNTTDNLIYVCTALNTWTNLSSGGTPTFETIYAGDIDLITTNGIFTINTGTNDFVVDSNDWNVTASGAFDAATITSNGALTAAGTTNLNGIANFNGVTTIGDGGDTVAINSSAWDISTAGIGSGFTGFTSTGAVDFSGASRLALRSGASTPLTCTEGDIFYNTTDNQTYVCTATNTFTTISPSTPTFETIYAGDTDLTTTNGAFTITTGTNDFIVDSNDWNVTASGAFDAATITSNGALTATGTTNLNGAANLNGITAIGDGGDTVAISSSTWNVSATGLATGLTGISSTGNIDFSGATTTFRMPSGSLPATCTVGMEFYDTTANTVKTCTTTNTWTTNGTGTQYLFGYDTTSQPVLVANSFQMVTFNTPISVASGWTYSAGNFIAPITGLYMVTYSAQAGRSNNGDATVTMRATNGGTEIPGSVASTGPSRAHSVSLKNTFIASMTTGGLLQFQVTSSAIGNAIGLQIPPLGNGTVQPTITATIVRIN